MQPEQMCEQQLNLGTGWLVPRATLDRAGPFSVFSAAKCNARGYCNLDNLIAMVSFVAGKLDLPVRPNSSTLAAS